MQGIISSPHLDMTLLFNISRRWSLYLNRCVAASVSESLDAPRCHVPFLLEPILSDLEGKKYVRPICPTDLRDLVTRSSGRGGDGGDGGSSSSGGSGSGGDGGDSGSGGGGATAEKRKSSTMVGGARVQVRYDAHLPALFLRDGGNSR